MGGPWKNGVSLAIATTHLIYNVDARNLKIVNGNGSLGSLSATLMVNGSLDSAMHINNFNIRTLRLNSTAYKVEVFVGHVDLLEGKYFQSQLANTGPSIAGLGVVSFDNLNFAFAYNCLTGRIGYLASANTSIFSLAKIAQGTAIAEIERSLGRSSISSPFSVLRSVNLFRVEEAMTI
ncbi:MAG TPA: hypothetical protein VGS11_10925 [Candidatus Bathyarchaeia archaeon]|nr:hypothetical protein [Candidatus Bathyarchaeia archaeon]